VCLPCEEPESVHSAAEGHCWLVLHPMCCFLDYSCKTEKHKKEEIESATHSLQVDQMHTVNVYICESGWSKCCKTIIL